MRDRFDWKLTTSPADPPSKRLLRCRTTRFSGKIPMSTAVALMAAGLLCLAGSMAAAAEAPRRPNIVLIFADDVGQETLGCYGGTSYDTPHLDRLAAGGMRFDHAYAMPVCHPSRITLLTGRYPFRWDYPRWGSFPKQGEAKTFAHMLKKADYNTAVAGKWQLALLKNDLEQPHRLGFDDYSLFGWHEGPRYFAPLIWQNGRRRRDVADRYGPDVYCDFLIDFIERHRDEPFMAFYSMALCHDVTDDLAEPVPFGPQGRYESYHEMIEQMDRQVGRLVAALDRLELREKTLVLFTADNGTSKSSIITAKGKKLIREPVYSEIDGRKVRGGKGNLTDDGTRVPLIANWPGMVKRGQVVDTLVDLSDYLPTFAELAGVELGDDWRLDGKSFAGQLTGEPGTSRPWVFAELRKKYWVRDQHWKLYGDRRFFNMKKDPQEKNPLATKDLTGKAAAAHKKLESVLAEMNK